MYVGVPTDPPRGACRLTARPADPQGLGQPRGGRGPPPPYSPQNCRTPLGVTHWLAAARVHALWLALCFLWSAQVNQTYFLLGVITNCCSPANTLHLVRKHIALKGALVVTE